VKIDHGCHANRVKEAGKSQQLEDTGGTPVEQLQ